MITTKAKVYVIDDDSEVTESLRWLLDSVNYEVESYTHAQDFLDNYKNGQSGCLVLDIRMPDITGLELQEILLKKSINIPIIFMTAYADVPMAVRAMKLGAVDFLTKPVNNQTLLEAINKALKVAASRGVLEKKAALSATLLDKLTPREREIIYMILDGELNKNIATKLGISQKTVELHRSNIMRKFNVRNTAQLVRIAIERGLVD